MWIFFSFLTKEEAGLKAREPDKGLDSIVHPGMNKRKGVIEISGALDSE